MGAMSFVKVVPTGAPEESCGPIDSIIQTARTVSNFRISLLLEVGSFQKPSFFRPIHESEFEGLSRE
jgi:hypothetical protein